MGVQGLIQLVDDSQLLEDLTLTNSHIVIDAPNLYYSLYFDSHPKLDQSHGGDYSAFRDVVCQFFQVLHDCDVTPHVVLDGGSGPEKLETLKSRLEIKIAAAKKRAGGNAESNILPPLSKDVFKQVLAERKVQFEESLGEADPRVAALANELHCPVLSNDSDFFIYDLEGGFLPLSKFRWKFPEGDGIPAKLYRRSEFCRQFGVDPVLMPVFAATAGNDYSRLDDRGKFERTYPPRKPTKNWKIKRLHALLKFLSGVKLRNVQDSEQKQKQALTEMLRFVSLQTNEDPFWKSVRQYDIVPVTAETRGEVLPQWMIDEVKKGKLTSFVTDVVRHHRMMLTPLVEDFSQPSSYSAALPIRRFFYGLLLGQETCSESDRAGESVSQTDVPPLHPSVSPEQLQQLQLQHLDQAPEHLRRHVLLEALDSLGLDLENVPDRMKLPVCVSSLWWKYRHRNHSTAPNVQHLHALLLGFVYGQHLDPGGEFESRMDDVKAEGERSQLQPDVAHAFSQWQCCFRQSLHLNQLLRFPLPEPDCSRLYCGPLLHQLTAGAEIQPDTIRGLMSEEQRRLFDALHTPCASLEHEGSWQEPRKRKREPENHPRKKRV